MDAVRGKGTMRSRLTTKREGKIKRGKGRVFRRRDSKNAISLHSGCGEGPL